MEISIRRIPFEKGKKHSPFQRAPKTLHPFVPFEHFWKSAKKIETESQQPIECSPTQWNIRKTRTFKTSLAQNHAASFWNRSFVQRRTSHPHHRYQRSWSHVQDFGCGTGKAAGSSEGEGAPAQDGRPSCGKGGGPNSSHVLFIKDFDNADNIQCDPVMEKIRIITSMFGYANAISSWWWCTPAS